LFRSFTDTKRYAMPDSETLPEDHLAHLSRVEANRLISYVASIRFPTLYSQVSGAVIYALAAIFALCWAMNSYSTKPTLLVVLAAAAGGALLQLSAAYAQEAFAIRRDRNIAELLNELDDRLNQAADPHA
jgi:hypothetical protein